VAGSLRLDGLEQLRAAFRQLPRDMQQEVAVIVQAHAEEAKRKMEAAYPVRTYGERSGRGNLRKGLTLEARYDPTTAHAVVRNRAKHAWIYEKGTGPRKWANGKSTGSMPAGNVFVPIAIPTRRHMELALVDVVRRAGFDVTGFD